MTGQQQNNPGDLVATRADRGNVAILHVVAVAPHDNLVASSSAAADLGNVIPFTRARRAAAEPSAPPVTVDPADRPAPPLVGTKPWLQAVLVACSLIVHGGLFYAFWQEPQPLPGFGTQPIIVDVIIGDNRAAGISTSLGLDSVDQKNVEEVKAEEKPVEQEQLVQTHDVKPEKTRTEVAEEVAKEQAVEQPKEQKPEQRQQIAMVETPQAETPTVLPRETPPDMQAVIAPPREQPKEARPERRAKQKKPSQPRDAASGVGQINASPMANYAGLASAHLRRHQQYPAAARSGGITGSGVVIFSISGTGNVTSVSVLHSTGSQVLDQEMTAMVRRSSPFPAPPDGQPKKYSSPIVFGLTRSPSSRP
jgi:periplasmic protein TonB